MYDIITIGGGPSGAYVSYLLAREGFKVLLLDKGKPGDKVCTGVISEEAFQSFPLNRKCILREIRSIEFVSPSGEGFTYEHPKPFAHIVDRKAFDSMLLDMAQEAGASFLCDARVASLEVAKGGVSVRYGKDLPLRASAQALILAAGLNRNLLRMAGLRPPDYMKAVQVEVDNFHCEDHVKVFLGQKIAPGSFAWVVPLGNGKARIGMSTRSRIMPYFNRFLRRLGLKDDLPKRSRPIPYGMAPRTYADRVLVVGDAAGQAKTTTGGGIYYGLIGAGIATHVLKEAFSKGDLSKKALRVYEERWKEVLLPEIEMGLRLRGVFSSQFNDEKINSLINLALNDGIATLIRLQAKFDWQRTFFASLLRRLDIKSLLS